MSGRVRYTPSAEGDLLEAWLSVAMDDPGAADRLIEHLHATASVLGTQPRMGRARPELGSGVRCLPTQTRYILYYRPEPEGVVVVRVLHHARDLGPEFFDSTVP